MSDGEAEARPSAEPTAEPNGVVERLLTVDPSVLDRLFAASLFLFFGVILAMTPQYRPDSQLFPLVIGVPTFVLIGVLLLVQSSDRVSAFVGRFSSGDVFEFDERFSNDTGSDRDDAETLTGRRTRLLAISGWMVLLLVLVVLVGFIPATVAFLLGFYLLNTDLGLVRSILYTAVCTVTIILIFGVVMGMRFYEGLLGLSLPI